VALNTYRSRLHQDRRPWLGRKPVEPVDTAPSLQNALEQGQRAELVRRAFLTLPARYRDAILMYYFEDLDIAESARVLGIAEGTLKAQLHRARELLRSRCEAPRPPVKPTSRRKYHDAGRTDEILRVRRDQLSRRQVL